LREFSTGRLTNDVFRECSRVIRLHGHCHQKALTGISPTVRALELVPGHDVRLIASGCCGMAGSFGYEAEHYALSQEIGELVLLPTVRQEPKTSAICAPGTSCRHQIHDATGRRAQHPAEILWEALG
jgi:Fe-S oxidoreductase